MLAGAVGKGTPVVAVKGLDGVEPLALTAVIVTL
jgi:hypothetical protein